MNGSLLPISGGTQFSHGNPWRGTSVLPLWELKRWPGLWSDALTFGIAIRIAQEEPFHERRGRCTPAREDGLDALFVESSCSPPYLVLFKCSFSNVSVSCRAESTYSLHPNHFDPTGRV